MYKKNLCLLLCFLVICIFLFGGCSSSKEIKAKKENLIIYSKEIKNLRLEESKIFDDYNSVTGENYTNDKSALIILKKLIIPNYTSYLEKVKKIIPTNDEIQELHKIYIDYCTKILLSFINFKESLEEKNSNKLKEGRKNLNDAQRNLERFQKSLNKISSKYNIQLS
ncbi:hypothetical protein [Hathewaya limosa]|uniref:Lipoprotein n=1 Tax=Hathewaya limosa TaxID=1536 RepID=A0ABU0JSK9_HATLI|nr:hypothetical protein [Hathewaya limosa]MDQ0480077.1 hypothetical protein [Hathewaya limosa]